MVADHDHVLGTLHSVRHMFATVAAGVAEEAGDHLLNHTPKMITGQLHVRLTLESIWPAMKTVVDVLENCLGGCLMLDKLVLQQTNIDFLSHKRPAVSTPTDDALA